MTVDRTRYFDNAATTPVDPRVKEEMLPFLGDEFGNASSIHGFGARAMRAVDAARERVAELLGAEDPSQIVFTSGATESNNWVLSGFPTGAVSPFEHSAVREPALRRGFAILPNDGLKIVPPTGAVELVSVMSVNNELGTIWRPQAWKGGARYLHSDITQQAGKLQIDLQGIDFASLSAHKFYGPKGVGALYFAAQPPAPCQLGGEQENGMRAGTLNTFGIVGMGAAARIAFDDCRENFAYAQFLRDVVMEELRSLSDCRVNGGENVSPYILSVSVRGIEGESIVVDLDRAGFAVSAGAACSSRSSEPSHVLTALGIEEEWRRGTVRISFGRFNTADSARDLAKTLLHSAEKIRTMSGMG